MTLFDDKVSDVFWRDDPAKQVEILRSTYLRFTAKWPFRPGDLVIHISDYRSQSTDPSPCIVLEVGRAPEDYRPSTTFGHPDDAQSLSRADMRVATFSAFGQISTCWVESWEYEPWTGEGPANG